MLTTNLQNMIESRAITTDYMKEYVNSDTYVRRFMDINKFKMVENQAQSTYESIIHLYNMGIMAINNMWDCVNNTYLDLTLEKAIIFCIVDCYGYNNGIDYIFQHIYIDGVSILHINNNKHLHGYLTSNYNNITIDVGIDDYIYNDVRLIDAIASMVDSTYPNFDADEFLEYLLSTPIFNTTIETRVDMTSKILSAQNEVIEKYLKYDNYLAIYRIIDPVDNLSTNIAEISSIVNLISQGSALDLDMDVKKGFQFFVDGINLKEFNSYETSSEMINEFKNINLDYDIRYSFVEDVDARNVESTTISTTIEFNSVAPHIIHTTIRTENNEDELNNPTYIAELFKITPTISDLNQALQDTKRNIKGKFTGIIANAFREIAGISDAKALRLLNNEILQFVGPNLVDPLNANIVLTEEAVTEYLLNMKQDLMFNSINNFMSSLQNKLQGISTINEVWNINLLQTFMDGVASLIKSTADANKINDDIMHVIYLKIVEEFAKITNAEGIKLIMKIDADLKVILHSYICKNIINNFNDVVIDFTFDYLNTLKDMFKLDYILDDNFNNRVIIENSLKSIMDKIILPTFIHFIFGTNLSKLNSQGAVRYGSFTAIDKNYVKCDTLINSVLRNDVSIITDAQYLATDAAKLLERNLQTVNYANLSNQLQFIDSSSSDVIINYNSQKFWVKVESEYAKCVRPVLIGLNMVEVDYPITADLNLTIGNRLKICSSDIFRKSTDPVHTGTTALISMFIEYSVKVDKYAFRPEAKKYYTDDYLRKVNRLFTIEVDNGLGGTATFGKSYNIYLLSTNLNSVVFTRSCDFYKYAIPKPVVKMKNKDYVLLMSDSVELYNGSTYLFNSYKCTPVNNDAINKLILSQFKLNRSLLDDISLDVIDRDHRDLSLNVEAYEKYLALKYILTAEISNALSKTNLLSSFYTTEVSNKLKGSVTYKMFHDMYGIHRR